MSPLKNLPYDSKQPDIVVTEKIKEEIKELSTYEKQTTLHCSLLTVFPCNLRIHPTTYLIENNGDVRNLISSQNICFAPDWKPGNFFEGFMSFTLVFEGLGKDCTSFYLKEFSTDNSEDILFKSDVIIRNNSDVYKVEIKEYDS